MVTDLSRLSRGGLLRNSVGPSLKIKKGGARSDPEQVTEELMLEEERPG